MPRKKFPSDYRPWFRVMIGFTRDTAELTDQEFRAFCCCMDYAAEHRAKETKDTITVTRSRITSLAPNARTSLVTSMKTLESLCGKMLWRMTINRRESRRPNREQTASSPRADRELTASTPPKDRETTARGRRAESEKVASITICIRNWSKYQSSDPKHLRSGSGDTPEVVRSNSVEAPPLLDLDLESDSERRETPQTPRADASPESDANPEPERNAGKISLVEKARAVLASGGDGADQLRAKVRARTNAGQPPGDLDQRQAAIGRMFGQLSAGSLDADELKRVILAETSDVPASLLEAACQQFIDDPEVSYVPKVAKLRTAARQIERRRPSEVAAPQAPTQYAVNFKTVTAWLPDGTPLLEVTDLLQDFSEVPTAELGAVLRTLEPDAKAGPKILDALARRSIAEHNSGKTGEQKLIAIDKRLTRAEARTWVRRLSTLGSQP